MTMPKKTNLSPQTVSRSQYETALARTREIVQDALQRRSYATTTHNMANAHEHIGQPPPTEYDTAASAYMQGITDVVLMLKDRGHGYDDLFGQST